MNPASHSGRWLAGLSTAVTAGLLVISCTFTLDQKYISPIQPPPDHTTATIEITDPDFQDPFFLDWTTAFTLKIETDKKFRGAYIEGGESSIQYTFNTGVLGFELNPGHFNDGTHTIIVKVWTSTGSGSLADRNGSEVYEIQKTFHVTVQRSLPVFTAPTAAIENGYMTYRWSVPGGRQLDYGLTIRQKVEGSYAFIRSKSFSDPKNLVYVDSGYVGGEVNYDLQASNFANYKYYPSTIKRLSPVRFSFLTDANKAGSLSWQMNMPSAIVTVIGSSQSTVPISQESLACDTIYLGDRRTYRVYLYRNTYYNQRFDTTITVNARPNIKPFRGVRVLPLQSKLIVFTQSNTYRLNLSTLTKEDSLSRFTPNPAALELTTSLNGQYASYIRGGAAPLLFDPLNFAAPVPYGAYYHDPLGVGRIIPVNSLSPISDNGFLGFSFTYNALPSAGISDINIDPLVAPYDGLIFKDSANVAMPAISSNGQYFAIESRSLPGSTVYERISSVWNVRGTSTKGKMYFRGSGSSELISIGASAIQVFDVSQPPDGSGVFQPVRTFNYAGLFAGKNVVQVDYDPIAQHIFIEVRDPANYSTLFIYTVSTFALHAKAKAYVPPVTPEATRHFYMGNRHFLSTGFVELVP